ncbi:MAG: SDR family NAD(P)-dependent oxidoreductase [Alistipes sp.]
MKHIIIVGATSGIGLAVAKGYLKAGWQVGAAGRRIEILAQLQALAPDRVTIQQLDVTQEDAPEKLRLLIKQTGGMDLYFHASGIGHQNIALQPDIEIRTAQTNAVGFVRMVTTAFNYFKQQGGGHIGVISSIAGTKGLGSAPAYSATKRFQNTYIDALTQLAHMEHLGIRFTDIRPGFVATDLLKDGHYPMLMQADRVAAHIVRALDQGKRRVVIDRRYAMLVFFWRLLPQCLWERLTVKSKKSRKEQD